jgi:hypothetical protein
MHFSPMGSNNALSRLERRLKSMTRITPSQVAPLLNTWKQLVIEDNKNGVLAGTDKDGKPAPPVKPRKGRGNGPRLAPRGVSSAVISKFEVRTDATARSITAGWAGVKSKKGVAYLAYHFAGAGRNPRYDLRGVRPAGRSKMASAMQTWIRGIWRTGT